MQRIKFSFFLIFLVFGHPIFAVAPETNLKKINSEISHLKETLASKQHQKSKLYLNLAKTEKDLSFEVQQVKILEQDLNKKALRVDKLKQDIYRLNQDVKTLQLKLANDISVHYKRGSHSILKWVFHNNHHQTFEQMLIYNRYLMDARQKDLAHFQLTQNMLLKEEALIKDELSKQQARKHLLLTHQNQLDKDKQTQEILIKHLATMIQSEEQKLAEFEKNKENLTKLIQSLSFRETKTNKAFSKMQHQLPKPLTGSIRTLPSNQGLRFLAKEGSAVYAIYPGKIVFSDWLKGYGLLLIIDHGQGYMTLYANNQALFKTKGSYVKQSEQIATVGHSGGHQEPGLYFEIRANGKTLPPMQWLKEVRISAT